MTALHLAPPSQTVIDETDALLDVRTVCERIGIKKSKAYEMMGDGTMPWRIHPHARKRVVRASWVRDYIAGAFAAPPVST